MPEDEDLIKWILLYFYRDAITNCTKEHCYGCEADRPGQRDHMEGGCLTDWIGAVDKYFPEVNDKVSRLEVTEVFKKVKSVLEVNVAMTEPDLLTIGLMLACVEQTLEKDLKTKDLIPNDFYMLIESVRE